MRLEITGRHVEVTPELRRLIRRHLAKLERLLNDSAVSAQVVVQSQKRRCVSEVTLHAKDDHILHGVGDAANWSTSIRGACEKIAHQASRLKGKWTKRRRRATSTKREAATVTPPAPRRRRPGTRPSLRATSLTPKPMTVEDAVLGLESQEDGVLVFRDADRDRLAVMYRRDDGRVVLIEPET